jgi:hypothetical protein
MSDVGHEAKFSPSEGAEWEATRAFIIATATFVLLFLIAASSIMLNFFHSFPTRSLVQFAAAPPALQPGRDSRSDRSVKSSFALKIDKNN